MPTPVEKLTIHHFQRKRPSNGFGIEGVFELVRKALRGQYHFKVAEASVYGIGIVARLKVCLDAWRLKGELIHVTGDIHYAVLFLKCKKVVLTIHDVGIMYEPGVIRRMLYLWFYIRLPVAKAAVITTVSEATRQDVIRFSKCNPSKVRVVYNPLFGAFRRAPIRFRDDSPLVLHIGMAPNKNFNRLIQALEGLRCRLLIIGTPSVEQEAKLIRSGLSFRSESGLSEAEVYERYVECDLLAFVSTLEGFGLPIIEANAVGRPVVTSNISSMPEIAGDAACLVDPYDVRSIREGIEKVINDKEYRMKLVSAGFQNAQRYALNKCASLYSEIYSELQQA